MVSAVVVSVLALVVAAAEAWPNLYDNEFKRWSLSRRSYGCKNSGGECYSTSDCCKRYVCAAIDDEASGLNPTTPGWCVHEKELEPCVSNLDCNVNEKCVNLGASRYCVKMRPQAQALADDGKYGGFKNKGGLGSNCEDDSDCDVATSEGTKLCCQKIRMGRGRPQKRCDRITPISTCITKKK